MYFNYQVQTFFNIIICAKFFVKIDNSNIKQNVCD